MATSAADGQKGGRVRAGEWRALACSCLYFFCVLAAYYVARPVRDQLSAAVGSIHLPKFYAATFVTTLVLSPLFAALVARLPRRQAIPVVYGFFIACLLGFVPLFLYEELLGPRVLGTIFFVWISVFNLFVVSVFWSVMTDIWTDEQARRMFPLIGVAGTAGAVCGPYLTGRLVGILGVGPLLAVSAFLLAVAIGCFVWLGRWSQREGGRRGSAREGRAIGGGMLDGLRQIVATPFMRNMALLLLLADGIGTINYALVIDYSGLVFDSAVERTRFAADLDLAANLLTVLVQLALTSWLLPRKGPGVALLVWAGVVAATLVAVALSADPHAPLIGAFPAVAIAVIVGRGLAYGIAEPARHSLFAQVSRGERYKGQNAVDTAVWRFGDLAIALGMNGLRSMGWTVVGFAGLAATSAGAAAVFGWWAARGAARAATTRESR